MAERQIIRMSTNDTAELVVYAGRCRLVAIVPELTTTGTLTFRQGATGGSDVKHVCAIGLTQQGKEVEGAVFPGGITLQRSVGTDIVGVVVEPV